MKTPEELAEQYAKDKEKAYYVDENGKSKFYITERGRYSKEDFLAGYAAAQPKWISVKEKLPEEDKDVLIYVPSKDGDSAHWLRDYHLNGKWIIHGYEPTHWMPLPEPPKENE